jgi:hypothetical protein
VSTIEEIKVVDLLMDIHKEMAVISANQAAMKADLKTHIKRTDLLEDEVKRLWKLVWLFVGALTILPVLHKMGILTL